jgi:two-component system, NarL family, response regulator NreC
MNKIRLLLADDHPIVRAGMRAFLEDESDMLIVGEASNACQAVALAQELRPDVAILDILMPGNGLDATRQIRAACLDTQVLILTFHAQERFLALALQAGAAGYVLKSAVDAELLAAIRIVAEGGVFLHPSGAKILVDDYQARPETKAVDVADPLSEREREVVKLLALGYTTSEAAGVLTISPKSVETYRTRIMQKLGVHSRVELVQYALLHHLLTEELQEELP